jgi:hypothetical protein
MTTWRWERWAVAAGGVVFVVLQVISSALFHPPAAGDPIAEIVQYFHEHRRAGVAASILGIVSVIPFLWLIGGLAIRLWRAAEERLALTALGGALAAAATVIVGAVVQGALVHQAVTGGDSRTTKVLYDVVVVSYTFAWAPMVALLAATGIAVLRSRTLPAWYGYASGAMAVLSLSAAAALTQTGFYTPAGGWTFVVYIVFFVWILATSLVLAPRADEPEEAPTAVAA